RDVSRPSVCLGATWRTLRVSVRQLTGGHTTMKASPESAIINSALSVASQVSSRFALFCLLALALFGCSGGSSTPKLPSASKLPSSCTAATVGSNYSCTITVTGGTAPFTWTVTGLPAGVTSNASTDTTSTLTISGTPQSAAALRRESTPRAALSAVTDNVQITVTDSQHHTANLSFVIMLAPPAALTVVTTSPLSGGTAGSSYSSTVTASGGTTPYSWNITGLPAGLSFTSATPSATISGTTDDAGTFTVMATVTDSAATPATASATLSLTIAQATALMVSTTALPNGTVNVAYSQTLAATGGVTPYKFSLASGALPAGFSISTAGVISGTATSTGTS